MGDTKPKTYIRDESFDPIYKSVNFSFYFKSKILSGILMALGFLILGTQVVFPLVSFKTQDDTSGAAESTILGAASGFRKFEFLELGSKDKQTVTLEETPQYFYLSVPRLGIQDALVETNSTNLSPTDSLGHYNGSSLPGKIGNAFIYGHSVLPWFYNPRNYKTIFSTLGNLQIGDEVYIDYDEKELTFKVEGQEVLTPNLVDPLGEWKPKYLNESTIVLMTCWPAGTKTKRLVVKATLID
ncbi:sortase [Patescibacteria group bacterium]